MSHDDVQRTPPWVKQEKASDIPEEQVASPDTPAADSPSQALGDTVGTGTSIAIGCIAGTVLLILIGLVFIGIAALF